MASRRPIRPKEIQNPERILNNLLKDYVEGNLDDYGVLFRASVVKVDQVGGALETTPPNPRNSIQARIITNARDKDLDDTELPVFWPMFPHDIMPIKVGEHVYVLFEDANEKSHGLWISRIPEPAAVDNVNLTPGIQKYQNDTANDFSQVGAEQAVQDTDSPPTAPTQPPEFIAETVPKFVARVGDRVIEGSNNTLIVLGRDRITDPASGEQQGAGTIDLVVGRAGPDNLNMATDKSRIYITMKSDVDANFAIQAKAGPAGAAAPAIVAESQQIRIHAKDKGSANPKPSVKILVEGGEVIIEGAVIVLGNNADDAAVLGKKLVDYLQNKVVVNTPAGPGKLVCPPDGSPPGPSPNQIAAQPPGPFYSFFSKKVQVKS